MGAKIKRRSPGLPVIMLTGHGARPSAKEPREKGAFPPTVPARRTIEQATRRLTVSATGSVVGVVRTQDLFFEIDRILGRDR